MSYFIARIRCFFSGHSDLRIVSVDTGRNVALYRCAACNTWWTE